MNRRVQKTQVVYFKRWTRQKYAIFNSLKKQISIATIALVCSFVSRPVTAQAQNDTLIQRLNELTVSEEKLPETPNLATPLLQVSITKSEIERVPVQSLNDLLDRLQGLDIRQRSPLSTQADISYRGGNFDQTLILLNGFNMTDPQTGHYTLNLPVNQDIIQKIELFNNTTAFLFGTSPFSGLVNIVTRPDTVNSIAFHVAGGSFEWINTGATLNLKSGKFTHLLSADYNRSDGYRHNTDFKTFNAFYQTIGRFGRNELEMQAGYSGREYGANGFYSLKFPDQYETLHTAFAGVKWKHYGRVFWSPSLYYRANFDCFELIKGQNPTKNNYHFNQAAGANFLTYFFTRAGKTSFSADVRVEDIFSTSLGDSLLKPKKTFNDTIFYNYGKLNLNSGIAVSQHYENRGWTANLTLLLQHFTHAPKKIYLLPATYISYKLRPQAVRQNLLSATFYLSGADAMRMPTFTDLYYKTGDIIGNSNLQPEKAYTVDAGASLHIAKAGKSPYLTVSVAYFNRWGRNMIDYIKSDTDIKWRSINHTAIHFQGVEASLCYQPNLQFNNNFFITNILIEYAFLHSNKKSQGFQSRYVLDHLMHKLAMRLNHRIYKGLSADWSFSINRRQGEYISYQTDAKGILTSYPVYYLLDVRLSYTYKMLNFYAEAANLLNQHYFDLGDLEQPGIWIRGGIKCKVGF
ncbi:MAG: TonB-dependent receptor plug domain-containing protein [Bacteroidales bacterium]|jgi:iron complex outermembrane receptor protein|nr:TonB-dependent receptor plug domain-containing protein [Bacteroidales bacterium]